MFNNFLRLYHTVKYLKIQQIFWRFFNLFPRYTLNEKICPEKNIITFLEIPQNGITYDYDSFKFLGEEHKISKVGWDYSLLSKLWRYNLHYFDFLRQEVNSKESIELQKNIISKWVIDNPVGKGTGWEPYPTSLRIVNWIKWDFKTSALNEESKLSLWKQILWLADRLEYHILGNHLFVNSKALLFASYYFGLDEFSSIHRVALKILNKELKEQFLRDGAHFELSPMYHALAMEDLLDLYQLKSPKLNEEIKVKFNNGMNWLSLMKYENDELSHFNDCANGIAPRFKELEELGIRLGLKSRLTCQKIFTHLMESGFVVFKDRIIHLIADLGQIGPDYIPAHAHADTLSFELAINGVRLIVNSGTSSYELSDERLRQRSTSAHSTIEVDGQSSSEVWSSFRVARRALVSSIEKINNKESVQFSAIHDGYTRLVSRPKHKRMWKIYDKYIEIFDELSGVDNKVQLRFYLHPDIIIESMDGELVLSTITGKLGTINTNHYVEIISTTYHEKFGLHQKNKCLLMTGITPFSSKVTINWNL